MRLNCHILRKHRAARVYFHGLLPLHSASFQWPSTSKPRSLSIRARMTTRKSRMSTDETAQADTNAARVKKCGAGAGGARRKRNLITGWNYSSSTASKALFVPIMGEIQVETKPTNGMPCAPYTAPPLAPDYRPESRRARSNSLREHASRSMAIGR